MKNIGPWIKITLSLALIAGFGAGVWATIHALDPSSLRVIVGFVLAILAFVVVGALLAGKDLLQAYLIRRAVQQDDLNDLRQMAFITRLMPGNNGRVNVTLPGQGAPQLPAPHTFDGAYRDATIDQTIEVE